MVAFGKRDVEPFVKRYLIALLIALAMMASGRASPIPRSESLVAI